LLPATDLTIAGIVKHLAWAEDRWFQARLLGAEMPAPWDVPGADDPDYAMRLASGDSIVELTRRRASEAVPRSTGETRSVRLRRSHRSGWDRSTFAGSSFT
jgi:hypothetical protein